MRADKLLGAGGMRSYDALSSSSTTYCHPYFPATPMKKPPAAKKRKARRRAKGIREDGTKIGTARPVDVHVGWRVRQRRTLMGMSQEKLGEAVGLTFQQIQKYERGANRVGASRLYQLSRILDVPISFFFDDMPDDIQKAGSRLAPGFAETPASAFKGDRLARRETLELVRAYYRIADPKVRKRIFELAKTLGDGSER